MASKKKISELIALIKTVYPYYYEGKTADEMRLLPVTWAMVLQEYDDKAVNDAAIACVKTCKMPPTPADIIERIEQAAPKTTNEELFGKMTAALERCADYQYHFDFTAPDENGVPQGKAAREKAQRLYASLPHEIRAYIGSYGEFLRMARDLDDDTLKYERARFMRVISDIRQEISVRQIESGNMPQIGVK